MRSSFPIAAAMAAILFWPAIGSAGPVKAEPAGWHGSIVLGVPFYAPPPVVVAPPPLVVAPARRWVDDDDDRHEDWRDRREWGEHRRWQEHEARRDAYREGYREALRRPWEPGDRVDPRQVFVIADPWRWGLRPAPYGYGYVALGNGVYVMSLADGTLMERLR